MDVLVMLVAAAAAAAVCPLVLREAAECLRGKSFDSDERRNESRTTQVLWGEPTAMLAAVVWWWGTCGFRIAVHGLCGQLAVIWFGLLLLLQIMTSVVLGTKAWLALCAKRSTNSCNGPQLSTLDRCTTCSG
jgi:hypothetical protein